MFSWSAENEILEKTISKEDLYNTSGVCTEEKPRKSTQYFFLTLHLNIVPIAFYFQH